MKKILLTIFAPLLLTACGGSGENEQKTDYSPQGKPAKGDVYVEATIGEASNLLPWLASDKPSHDIAGYIYNGLLKYDKNLNLVGDLAESWQISDDGLTITFTIKKGIKWADGKPLTSADVLYSFQTITDPATLTPYSGDYKMVQTAKAPDDYSFQVTYAKPFAPALSSWTLAILPKHILEAEEDINKSVLKRNPMGTGPYKLTKWDSGKEIQLAANPDYFEHEPWLSNIRTRLIPDGDTQFLELKAGRIDTMALKPLQFTRLTNGEDFTSRYNKFSYLGNGYTYLGFQLNHPIFKDKTVRQALSYATPREQIVKGVLMGQGLPIACPFKPGTWAYNEKIKPYPHNVAKAKMMLDAAGWEDQDGDGVLEKDLGNGVRTPFYFTLMTNQGNDMRIKTAEILQQSFRQIGVKMEIQTQEWSTFIENTINKRQFDAFILGWSLSPEPDPFDIFHSSKTENKQFNIVGFKNAEADELMEKARGTFNQAERKKYLDKFQEIIHDEQPYLFLYAPYALVAVHKRIKNVEASPAGIGHNFIDWYVPKSQQPVNSFQ